MAVVMIEPEGAPKVLRVALPSPSQPRSARVIIDNEPAIGSAVTCFANRCTADYEATPELVDKLKKGQMLQIQVVNLVAPGIPFPLPLADSSGNSFAGANEGPPTDPRAFQEQQKKRCNDPTLYRCPFPPIALGACPDYRGKWSRPGW